MGTERSLGHCRLLIYHNGSGPDHSGYLSIIPDHEQGEKKTGCLSGSEARKGREWQGE